MRRGWERRSSDLREFRTLVWGKVAIYIDTDDRWIGWYKGSRHNYFVLIPCFVLRVRRRPR